MAVYSVPRYKRLQPMADIAIRERNAVVYLMSDLCSRLVGNLNATMGRAVAIAAALAATIAGRTADAVATLDHAAYGTTQGGQAVDIFTMTNDHGLRVRFLSLGGVITEIDVPDPAHCDVISAIDGGSDRHVSDRMPRGRATDRRR